jgi:hypothetical protein
VLHVCYCQVLVHALKEMQLLAFQCENIEKLREVYRKYHTPTF